MPRGYEHLLKSMLEAKIMEQIDEGPIHKILETGETKYKTLELLPEEKGKGIPQGGVISPLLMN